MSRLVFYALCPFAMVVSTTAYAQAPAAPQPAAAPQEAKAKKVCKSEPVIGSRFAKKVCHTPEEWQAIQQNDRAVAEGYQRNPCRAGAGSVGGDIQC